MLGNSRKCALAALASVGALGVAACGGGSSSSDGASGSIPPTTSPPDATSVAAAGAYKGTLTDSSGAETALIGFVDPDGGSVWMTPEGRVYNGEVPGDGQGDVTHLRLHDYEQDRLQDPAADDVMLRIERHSRTYLEGEFEHDGAVDGFHVEMHGAADRPGSLESVAGVYTRSLGNGYTMAMAITGAGEMTASDTLGCQWNGEVSVPDPGHNLYRVHADVTNCGDLDGSYDGLGALFDADEMHDFIEAMHPFEHGEHEGQGPHGHGGHMPGQTVVPTGTGNLFMFGLHDEAQHRVIEDALAR